MTPQDFYTQQTVVTNPNNHATLFDAIPDDIDGICRTVQGLIVHYFAGGYKAPEDRICEIDTRYVSAMLDRVLELDDSPLTEPRPTEKKMVGCCRDFTALTVSILRHKGIPARSRYGTAKYFEDGFYGDHVIVEYWNGDRWVGVDSQMDEGAIEYFKFPFDVKDVPHDQFLRGGRAWLMIRKEGADPNTFGITKDFPAKGTDFVITETLLDLAALNGKELLCWDVWGFSASTRKMTDADKAFLDRVAEATLDDSHFEEWKTLFQHEKLRVPTDIRSWTPAVPPDQMPVTVHLKL
jgi:hypothetical protein